MSDFVLIPYPASGAVEAFLLLTSGAAAADWKFGWNYPTAATATWGAMGDAAADTTGFPWFAVGVAGTPSARLAITATQSIGSVGAGGQGAFLAGRFTSDTNAGTIQLQAAQDTASATNNTVNKNSWMRLTRLV